MSIPPMKPNSFKMISDCAVTLANMASDKAKAFETLHLLTTALNMAAANDRAERMLAVLKSEGAISKVQRALDRAEVYGETDPWQQAVSALSAIHDLLASIATETQAQERGR